VHILPKVGAFFVIHFLFLSNVLSSSLPTQVFRCIVGMFSVSALGGYSRTLK